jgi:hypothetical protein
MISVTFSTMPDHIGVNPLTGEACALAMRILCDVSEEGAALVREYLGLPADCALSPAWNSTVGDKPAVASVMIERGAFPALVHFALMRSGCQYVYGRDDSADSSGFCDADLNDYPDLREYIDGTAQRAGFDQGARLYRNPRSSGPVVGTRHVHAFSGRAA